MLLKSFHKPSIASRLITTIAVVLFVAVSLAWASSGGPQDALTGAPGEGNCTNCHSSFALNSGPGSVVIFGPSDYIPGDTLDFRINVYQLGQLRWGFEATARTAANATAGTILATSPTRTQLSTTAGKTFLKHTSVGTDDNAPDSSNGWAFQWVAPAADVGPITFYAAGNAANSSGNTLGDYIYTTAKTLTFNPVCCTVAGDADNTGEVSISDAVYLVAYIFLGGAAPSCQAEGDADADGSVTIGDAVYLISYIFLDGPPPQCGQ